MSDENFIESFTINYIEGENIHLEDKLLMGLKCGVDCNHGSCLSYLIQNIRINGVYQFTDLVNSKKLFGRVIKRNRYERYQTNRNILPIINEMLPNLDHPNIMKYYGLSYFSDKMILFTECLNNGSLRKKIKPNVPFNIDMIYRYCNDILQAIKFLHKNQILHRFIHPANIYIDNNGGCKLAISIYSYSLADGDVQIDDEWLRVNKGYSFVPSELVENRLLSYPYDILIFGCTVIEMSTAPEIPFDYKSITINRMEEDLQRINDERLKSFIGRMLMENPTARATANQLLSHDFITNNNNQ